MSSEKPDVFFPWVLGDYFKDTRGLTRSEHGAYLLLLAETWLKGPLDNDDKYLATVTLSTAYEWKKIRKKLEKFFVISSEKWTSPRCERERELAIKNKAEASERGRIGGRASAKSRQRPVNAASASTVVGASIKAPTHSGQKVFLNEDFRKEAIALMGDDWVTSWLDQCAWRDLPSPMIIAPRSITADTVKRALRQLLIRRGVGVAVEAATG